MILAVQEKNSAHIGVSMMEELLKSRPKGFLKIGDLAAGTILEKQGSKVFIDLGGFGTGIIYGREYQNARDILKNFKDGDHISGKIVELESDEGFIELSIKEAGAEIAWKEIAQLRGSKEAVDLKVTDSNKGGLVLEFKGIKGFLPASQLKSAHYPRIEGGDKEKIAEELKKLVGEALSVIVLDFDAKKEKLIFSEKGVESEEQRKIVEKYKVGDVIEGEVTGIVDFGIFIKIEEGLEGLAHISELDWALVEDPGNLFKVGECHKAKIIAIDGDKVSLSLKALKPDPWEVNKENYKKGDIVKGRVLRLNKFGVLVLLDTGIYGLAHISEFGSEKKMREVVETGELYVFQIVVFQPENRKLSLAFLGKEGNTPQEVATSAQGAQEENVPLPKTEDQA